jgi:putative transcriptional regulator
MHTQNPANVVAFASAGAGRSRAVPGFDPVRLRNLRCSRAMLTQAELADLVGISRGEISHLERGRRQPLVTTLRRLCEVLECEPGDLITTEGISDGSTSGDGAVAGQQVP